MTATETLTRLGPYAERLAESDYIHENLGSAARNLRGGYERSQKRRVKAARDEKLRGQVRAAVLSIVAAGKALADGPQKPKRHRGRLLVLFALGAAVAGAALAKSQQSQEPAS